MLFVNIFILLLYLETLHEVISVLKVAAHNVELVGFHFIVNKTSFLIPL